MNMIRKPLTLILAAQVTWVRGVSQCVVPSTVRSTAASGSQVYESKRAVSEYLLFHFGSSDDIMPYSFGPKSALEFPQRIAELGAVHTANKRRALDLGCSVGGAAFHLSEHFDEVVGIDFSHHFVDAANQMKLDGKMGYQILEQGQIFSERLARLPQNARPERVTFAQGDATNMPASLGTFDLIIASNLLCRLPQPKKFLDSVSKFLNVGGNLLLISPYSWLEEYTPKEDWVGALSNQYSYDALKEYMKEQDVPLIETHREDVPFLIREHQRKFQYGVSDAIVFKRI